MRPLNLAHEGKTFDQPTADCETAIVRKADVQTLKNEIFRLEVMLAQKERRFVAVNARLLREWKRSERQRVKIERLCLFLRSRGIEPSDILGEPAEEPPVADPRTPRPEKQPASA